MSTSAHPPIDGQRDAMDRMYRFQRHIYDASRRFYLLGRERLIANLDVPPSGSVLEVGCGTGRNLVQVAKAYPSARLFGFDISGEMLKTADKAIARAGLSGRVSLAEGDACHFDPQAAFGVSSFDRVFLSYTLSMIPEWEMAVRQAAALVTPGGELHIADFGQCERLAAPVRSGLFWWLGKFDVSPRAELPFLAARVAQERGLSCSFESHFAGYAWNLRLSR